jgi:heme A synthase
MPQPLLKTLLANRYKVLVVLLGLVLFWAFLLIAWRLLKIDPMPQPRATNPRSLSGNDAQPPLP